jgi:hypothetical protein
MNNTSCISIQILDKLISENTHASEVLFYPPQLIHLSFISLRLVISRDVVDVLQLDPQKSLSSLVEAYALSVALLGAVAVTKPLLPLFRRPKLTVRVTGSN